jgi:hypothetical protein
MLLRLSCPTKRTALDDATIAGIESFCSDSPEDSESAKSEGALISRTGHRAVLWIFLILTCAVLALVGSALYTTDQNQPDRPGT